MQRTNLLVEGENNHRAEAAGNARQPGFLISSLFASAASDDEFGEELTTFQGPAPSPDETKEENSDNATQFAGPGDPFKAWRDHGLGDLEHDGANPPSASLQGTLHRRMPFREQPVAMGVTPLSPETVQSIPEFAKRRLAGNTEVSLIPASARSSGAQITSPLAERKRPNVSETTSHAAAASVKVDVLDTLPVDHFIGNLNQIRRHPADKSYSAGFDTIIRSNGDVEFVDIVKEEKKETPLEFGVMTVSSFDNTLAGLIVPREFKGWHDVHCVAVMANAIKEAKDAKENEAYQPVVETALKRFKTALGPALYPIQCQYERVELAELEWRVFHLKLIQDFCREIEAVLTEAEAIVEVENILNQCAAKKHPKVASEVEQLQKSFEDAKREIAEKGLASCLHWIKFYATDFSSCKRGGRTTSNPVLFSSSTVLTAEDKQLLQQIFKSMLRKKMKDNAINNNLLPETAAQFMRHEQLIQDQLLDVLLEHPHFQSMKQWLETMLANVQEELKFKKLAIDKTEAEEKAKLEKEIKDYQQEMLSPSWSGEGIRTVDPMCKRTEGYKGMEWAKFIQHNIQYAQEGYLRRLHKKQREKLFEDILSIGNEASRTRFLKEFELRIKTPRFYTMRTIAKTNSYDVEEKKESKNGKDEKAVVTADFWEQSKLDLRRISCRSEAQLALRRLLLDYIEERDLTNWKPWIYASLKRKGYDVDKLEHRRRQIQYLTSYLYRASAEEVDEDVLFTVLPIAPQQVENTAGEVKAEVKVEVKAGVQAGVKEEPLVGVSRVLKEFEQQPSPKKRELQVKLEAFMERINKGALLYLCQHSKIQKEIDEIRKAKQEWESAYEASINLMDNLDALPKRPSAFAPKRSPLVNHHIQRTVVARVDAFVDIPGSRLAQR